MTMFNKRHYQAIALVMQTARPANKRAVAQWSETIKDLADMFARDNSLFKYDLFLQACIPGQNVRQKTVKVRDIRLALKQ